MGSLDENLIIFCCKLALDSPTNTCYLFETYSIKTNDVSANFLLLNFNNCKFSASYIKKKLENNGIILRGMQSYNIKNALRLTIGNTDANNKVIKNFKKIFRSR